MKIIKTLMPAFQLGLFISLLTACGGGTSDTTAPGASSSVPTSVAASSASVSVAESSSSVTASLSSLAESSTPASVAPSSTPASLAASSSSSGGSDFNVPQPPASCSNIGNSIPENIRLHNIFDSTIDRANFADAARWYTESGNVQRFQLFDGDYNHKPGGVKRPRIEAFAPTWLRSASGGAWHEFSANYYLDSWDQAQRYAVFQIKTNDASNFIIQGLIAVDGSLEIARRSKGTIEIDNNVFRKPFNLRVRSNGFKFEVWYNCQRVIAEDHPQPTLESNATAYGWRWGLYRQQTSEDLQIGTTTMYVTSPKFD